jgi:phage tail protein X
VAGGVGYFFTAGLYSSGDRTPLEPSPQTQTARLAPDLSDVATETGEEAVHPSPSKGDLIEESAISGAPSRMDFQADESAPVSEMEEFSSPQDFKPPKTSAVTVEAGDTIGTIIFKEFGRMDEQPLEAVRELNPGIEDLAQIEVGQVIRLPESGRGADKTLPIEVEEEHALQASRGGTEETPIVPEKEGEFESVTEQTIEAKRRETPTTPDESFRTEKEIPVELGEIEGAKGEKESQAQTEQASLKKEAERPKLTLLATGEEVKEFFVDYLDRYTRMDSNGFISLFSSQAVQNGKDGLDEIEKTYSTFFKQSRELQYQLADMKIKIYQNSIVVRARYELDQIPKRGRKKKVWKGTIQWTLVRENDELMILSLDYQPQGSR